MTQTTLATSLLVIALALPVAASPGAKDSDRAGSRLEPLQSWQGIFRSNEALDARPESPIVTDPETWATLWPAWRGDETLPKLDFRRVVVLVGTVPGPNRARLEATWSDQSSLRTRVWGTRKGGPGFGYVLAVIPRDGLGSVDGANVPCGID